MFFGSNSNVILRVPGVVVAVHTALKPDLVADPSVCILTVMVGPELVMGSGMELPQNFLLYDP